MGHYTYINTKLWQRENNYSTGNPYSERSVLKICVFHVHIFVCLFYHLEQHFSNLGSGTKGVLDRFLLNRLLGKEGAGGGHMFSMCFVWACCHVGESNCHRATVQVIAPNVFPQMPRNVTVVVSINSLTLAMNS